MATTNIMLYVNFDSKTIGCKKNVMDYEVGEFTRIDGEEVMVYALFNLNEFGMKSLHYIFKRGLVKFNNFVDKLNYCVEEIINLTNNDDFGKQIIEEEKRLKEARHRRDLAICDAVMSFKF